MLKLIIILQIGLEGHFITFLLHCSNDLYLCYFTSLSVHKKSEVIKQTRNQTGLFFFFLQVI